MPPKRINIALSKTNRKKTSTASVTD